MENVILVDENDNQIGIAEKMETHLGDGKRHRAFSILIFNNNGQLMLQKRALGKYHSGGKWTNTCCGHPRPGENIIDAGKRRLKEEMGFDCSLDDIYQFKYQIKLENGLSENEFDHVLVGKYNQKPMINLIEAMDWQWIEIDKLNMELIKNPDKFSYWFTKIAKKILEN
ncbi:MAG: isopentenyl-diphosphate Delta-isomerase [bacterium]|nr:isopentenyl-diphosphate Delta-isomerase [bacterium]